MVPVGTASGTRKLRVLALHGYLQNAEVFRSRTGALRKALKKHCDLVFLDAPHEIKVDLQGNEIKSCGGKEGEDQSYYGWWIASEGGPPRESKSAEGWERSLGLLEEALERDGPFDGVLGFSMGAAASALLCAAIESKKVQNHEQFKFAILFGGFVPRDPVLADSLLSVKLGLPSLHYSGQNDQLVVEQRSRELLQSFGEEESTFVLHPQGHCIPSLREVREKVKEFVAAQQSICTTSNKS